MRKLSTIKVLIISLLAFALQSLAAQESKSNRFNLYLNTQMSVDAEFPNRKFDQVHYQGRQLRLEAMGNITPELSYHYRQQLNKTNRAESIDNMPIGLDLANIAYQPNEKFRVEMGRICAKYGSYEFSLNPIHIYQFSDFLNNLPCYFNGAGFAYFPNPKHEIHMQVLNNRAASFGATYAQAEELGLTETKLPLLALVAWNANFNEHFGIRYSYGGYAQTKDKYAYRTMLGHQLRVGAWQIQLDFMHGYDGLNTRYALMGETPYDIHHLSSVLNIKCRFSPEWGMEIKGAVDFSGTESLGLKNGRRSILAHAGLEYYPIKGRDLYFFLVGLYQNIHHHVSTDRAQLSLGFSYQIPLVNL